MGLDGIASLPEHYSTAASCLSSASGLFSMVSEGNGGSELVKGWKSISISADLYEQAKAFFERNREELRIREGIGSLTGFLNFCVRQYFRKNGIIAE